MSDGCRSFLPEHDCENHGRPGVTGEAMDCELGEEEQEQTNLNLIKEKIGLTTRWILKMAKFYNNKELNNIICN